jgi:FAD/FMN-containing dehydrogenase
VLDLSDMRALEIDVERRTAWAETGLTAGEFTTAAGAAGLAVGFGDTGSVGIGGITLGGGVGYLVRKYGLTIDSLLAADVVTAAGQLLRVDAKTHPDLYWAIRGGGGNFGVATRFKFQLYPVDTIVGGMLILPATPDTIASFIAAAEAAPEESQPLPTLCLRHRCHFYRPKSMVGSSSLPSWSTRLVARPESAPSRHSGRLPHLLPT